MDTNTLKFLGETLKLSGIFLAVFELLPPQRRYSIEATVENLSIKLWRLLRVLLLQVMGLSLTGLVLLPVLSPLSVAIFIVVFYICFLAMISKKIKENVLRFYRFIISLTFIRLEVRLLLIAYGLSILLTGIVSRLTYIDTGAFLKAESFFGLKIAGKFYCRVFKLCLSSNFAPFKIAQIYVQLRDWFIASFDSRYYNDFYFVADVFAFLLGAIVSFSLLILPVLVVALAITLIIRTFLRGSDALRQLLESEQGRLPVGATVLVVMGELTNYAATLLELFRR